LSKTNCESGPPGIFKIRTRRNTKLGHNSQKTNRSLYSHSDSLADSFARAGYLTVAPDMFNGTPRTLDIDVSNLATTQFLNEHDVDPTDAIIAKAVTYLRDTAGDDVRIGATGYCFGGRYSFRTTTKEGGAHVAFAAHPANLADDEITAVIGPASVAGAGESLTSPSSGLF
jgi:dienelactone hydrolase